MRGQIAAAFSQKPKPASLTCSSGNLTVKEVCRPCFFLLRNPIQLPLEKPLMSKHHLISKQKPTVLKRSQSAGATS